MAEIIVVYGGSGSGKSQFAEDLLANDSGKKYYIATMEVFGEEGRKKVQAHKNLRHGKGFTTIESPLFLENNSIEKDSVVIVECVGNLCANWLFGSGQSLKECLTNIKLGFNSLEPVVKKVVIVTNDIFSDGISYEEETEEYIRLMAMVNTWLAKKADKLIEVVYSIPVYHKNSDS